jgi:hypothetical protein
VSGDELVGSPLPLAPSEADVDPAAAGLPSGPGLPAPALARLESADREPPGPEPPGPEPAGPAAAGPAAADPGAAEPGRETGVPAHG